MCFVLKMWCVNSICLVHAYLSVFFLVGKYKVVISTKDDRPRHMLRIGDVVNLVKWPACIL